MKVDMWDVVGMSLIVIAALAYLLLPMCYPDPIQPIQHTATGKIIDVPYGADLGEYMRQANQGDILILNGEYTLTNDVSICIMKAFQE